MGPSTSTCHPLHYQVVSLSRKHSCSETVQREQELNNANTIIQQQPSAKPPYNIEIEMDKLGPFKGLCRDRMLPQ